MSEIRYVGEVARLICLQIQTALEAFPKEIVGKMFICVRARPEYDGMSSIFDVTLGLEEKLGLTTTAGVALLIKIEEEVNTTTPYKIRINPNIVIGTIT